MSTDHYQDDFIVHFVI